MTPERWQQVKRLFDAAVELEPEQRTEFLGEACAEDPSLRLHLEPLLHSYEVAGTFIDEPIARLGMSCDEDEPRDELRQIGSYEVREILGQGGMGTVYLGARADREYEQQVAIKVLRRELDDEELVRRFRSERQILANLDHPNIARLLEGGTTGDGRPYLVMEYVQGERLDEHCDARRLPIRQRLELFRKVCHAVHFAHQSLIVHRDLKPGNILVTAEGEPKLLDFGIAKLLNPAGFSHTLAATRTGLAPMTLKYASPEQVRGEVITTASDVYSLGVLLFETLSGCWPYRSRQGNPLELARAILEQEPEKPSTAVYRRPEPEETEVETVSPTPREVSAARSIESRKLRKVLRGDLDKMILKALHKEPQRRYGSAEELSQDIERYLTHRPIRAQPDRLTYRAHKFVRRYRWGVSVAALVFVMLLAFLAALLIQQQQILQQKERAEKEALRAEGVSRFMIDLFEISNPDQADGQKVTAYEVMHRGAQEIPKRLQGQPEVQAELLETIGQVYRNLGLYREAVPLVEQALDLRQGLEYGDLPSLANTLVLRADLQALRGEYEEAAVQYAEALALLRRVAPGDNQVMARSLSGLGKVYQEQGDYAKAERLMGQALAMTRRLFGDEHPRTAANFSDLASLLRRAGDDYAAAEEYYRKALEIYRGLYGEQHTGVASSLNNLALIRHAQGDYRGAEELYRTALEIQNGLYEESHPRISHTLRNLASSLYSLKRSEEAEDLCRKVLAMRREKYGDKHPRVAEALNLLGLIRRDRGDLDEAEAILRQSLAITLETLGNRHADASRVEVNLGLVLKDKGETEEAEQRFRDALEIARRELGERHRRVGDILHHLGRLQKDKGNFAEAEEHYRGALDLRRDLLGEEHPKVAETLNNLAALLRESGDFASAEGFYRDALRICRQRFGEDHARVAVARQGLASVLVPQGKNEEAEALARRALEILEQKLPADHLWTLAAQSVLGSCLTAQGKYAEAEPLLLTSYTRLKESKGAENRLTITTKQRLNALYEAWGKPGEMRKK